MKSGSYLFSFFACTLATFGFLAASEEMRHWFVIPVTLCGILIGADAIGWFWKLDPFDPVGILGLIGTHFFYLAPLLHVLRDFWMGEVIAPPDWRVWLGYMACLNALGLLVYRCARGVTEGEISLFPILPHPPPSTLHPPPASGWRLNKPWFYFLALAGLLVSGAAQMAVYARFGGIMGYIQTAMDYSNAERMQGMGMVFTVSESFPILAFMVFAVYARGKESASRWRVLIAVLAAFFVLKMLFGGLRGSRSNTIWGVFWALGIIHLWLRRVSRNTLVFGSILLVAFMYLYGLYKGAGLNAVSTFTDSAAREELAEKSHRTFETLLLGDLGRSDVQAYLLYRLTDPEGDYEYSWGRTYFGAAVLLIPKALWPERPPEKSKEGTEALYGRGTYTAQDWVSSRVYGLAGEAMLNFGPVAVPFAFALFGVLVGGIRRFLNGLRPGDPRLLLGPFLVIFAFSTLVSDSDNLLFFLIKDGLVPFVVLWFSTIGVQEAFPREQEEVSELAKVRCEP